MQELYSVPEAAKRLGGVSIFTVRTWLSTGKLRKTKIGGRTMVSEAELLRFIRQGQSSPCPKNQRQRQTDLAAFGPSSAKKHTKPRRPS